MPGTLNHSRHHGFLPSGQSIVLQTLQSTNCGTTIPLRLQVGQEEYYDYIFPEEAGAAPHLKLLELAYKHKRQKMAEDGEQKLADAAAAAEEDGDDATKQGGDDDDDEGGA